MAAMLGVEIGRMRAEASSGRANLASRPPFSIHAPRTSTAGASQSRERAFRLNVAPPAHMNVNAPQQTEYCIATKVM